jgi:hypothetical protein
VANGRHDRTNGALSAERTRRLDTIGFEWDPYATQWEETFNALVAYKAEHGDCNVPCRFAANPRLGQWVSTQRQARAKGTLSAERVVRLDGIGFWWGKKSK